LSTREEKFFALLSPEFAKERARLLSKSEKTPSHVKKILTLRKIYDRIIGGKKEVLPKTQVFKTKNIKF
jgi:hypothetical protein